MEHQEIAERLLWPLWRGIDPSYKSKYRASIWQQFEDNIRSAAYTSRLARFVDEMTRKLSIQIRADDVANVQAVVASGDDRAILKLLRDETTLLVLYVRMRNEERKAEFTGEAEIATVVPANVDPQERLF
jgi:hypothetical protein